jgi:arylformamidase
MRRLIYLSYFLDINTPAYGGGETFQSVPLSSMENGNSCNTSKWTFPNHTGTHIDCPRHFSPNGKTLSDYPAGFWIYSSVYLVDISPIKPRQLIDFSFFRVDSIPEKVEILFIKTGFGKFRQDSVYWESNPAFAPSLADNLRSRFSKLRVIGFDTISLSSWKERIMGREAHRAFLDHPQPILLLEDMDLSRVGFHTSFKQVIVCPLAVAQADAAPCTVLANVE